MKGRSEETTATHASPRLRSASRSRSSISLRLVRWGRSRPCTCKSFKVMLSPDQKGLRLRQNRKQEVIPLRQLLPELSLGDEHWVDLSGKASARRGQVFGGGPPTNRSDHHEIDVAVRLVLAPSKRAMQEGDRDLARNLLDMLLQQFAQPDRLHQKRPQVGEDRRLAVGPVVLAPALGLRFEQPARLQACDLQLNGPHGQAGAFGDLPQVEPLAGIQQEKLGNGQPRARGDQGFCDRGRMYIFLSHLDKKYIRRARALSSGAPPAAWKGWETVPKRDGNQALPKPWRRLRELSCCGRSRPTARRLPNTLRSV